MITIVYSHPYDGSFNHAVLETLTSRLEKENKEYTVLNLYADGFNPAVEAASLKVYSQGKTADALAQKYLDTLVKTDCLIFVFPVWWGMMPAMVAGFLDKVLLVDTAYKYDTDGHLVPDKINISRTIMFTTSQDHTSYFAPFFSDYLPEHVYRAVGFDNPEWYNCAQTAHGPEENRTEFLRLVDKIAREL